MAESHGAEDGSEDSHGDLHGAEQSVEHRLECQQSERGLGTAAAPVLLASQAIFSSFYRHPRPKGKCNLGVTRENLKHGNSVI